MNKINISSENLESESSEIIETEFSNTEEINGDFNQKFKEIQQEKEEIKNFQNLLQETIKKILNDKEAPQEDTEIIQSYVSTFSQLSKKQNPPKEIKENVESILKDLEKGNKRELTESDIKAILWLMKNFDKRLKNKDTKTITLSKWSYEPNIIKRTETYNCSGGAIMFASILKALGVKAYPLQVYHHMVTIVCLGNKVFWVDPIASSREGFEKSGFYDITDKIEVKLAPKDSRFGIIKLKDKVVCRDVGYLYNSIEDANKYVNLANYRSLVKNYDEIVGDIGTMKRIKKGETITLGEKGPSKEDLNAKTIIDMVEKLGGRDILIEKSNSAMRGILDQKIFEENQRAFNNSESGFATTTARKQKNPSSQEESI